ncbi:MAG: hypothetical protein CMM08_08105 [Rhodospirillaceae bacterium]|jgi:hypothetical protein|nr:hypothetical protein [Rhodospirillaceae bacterium]MDP6620928.1 pirin family protein [Alphaproteobacteria bacterium]|tara:strand:+ start:261 stop:1103 length:843 start_codon:yes stop_codon:yes gene_type:complete
MTLSVRPVINIVRSLETSDGAGVRIRRTIGGPIQENLDPFLLLDEFGSEDSADYIAGFPDHPHRGFETVTYMLAGRMRHQDSAGNGGSLQAGSVQWMTAGRGIVHSEMPEIDEGRMAGFQLWVNLPAADKMCAPRYQNVEPEEIPVVERPGSRTKVVAGSVDGVRGPVEGIAVEPLYLDVALAAGASFELPLDSSHTTFCYPFEGSADIGPEGATMAVPRGALAVLGEGDGIRLTSAESSRVLIVAGRPIEEPIARYGPFVMSTMDEIRQAFLDYQEDRF